MIVSKVINFHAWQVFTKHSLSVRHSTKYYQSQKRGMPYSCCPQGVCILVGDTVPHITVV